MGLRLTFVIKAGAKLNHTARLQLLATFFRLTEVSAGWGESHVVPLW